MSEPPRRQETLPPGRQERQDVYIDYLSELKTARDIVVGRPRLHRNFQLRLDDETIRKLKILAARKGTDVSAILRRWIKAHLDKELKSA